ncbi:response regulator [Aurantibacter crassamenti]|uniref:hybrid sensor histidine kinase/response regulator transcription factor n=1 Tax=Aurantibacter crassamenti TaxID=1837375 RepID=UPI001939B64D|nr:hybrid sensor histidine kinase/response regulator transcription factor [Aurantibacter crassamenti]MBM1107770.1 response regulator [Aurantibacter crassamenti]
MKFRALFKISILLIFFYTNYVASQSNDEKYTFVNIENAATQRAVTSIVQDKKGLIWMGTNGGGLYKYNGIENEVYKQIGNDSTSINSSLIYSMYLDSSNRLWVGTETGLNLFDEEHNRFIEINLVEETLVKDVLLPVYAITENDNGQLLIGTHNYGLFKLDTQNLQSKRIAFETPFKYSDLLINTIIKDKEGHLLIGTSGGLFTYENDNLPIKLANFITVEGPRNISEGVQSLIKDKDDNIWAGTFYNGMIKIVEQNNGYSTLHKFELSDKRVLSLIQAPDGNILCGTENDGLFVLNSDGDLIHNYRQDNQDKLGIKSNSVWSLFIDDKERIWMGSYNKGVAIYDKYYDKFKDIASLSNMKNSLKYSSVMGIAQNNEDELWLGIDGGGVDIYNIKTKKVTHLVDSNNNVISGLSNIIDVVDVFTDSKENLWVGTWNSGIFFLPKNGKSFLSIKQLKANSKFPLNRITSFAEDFNGTIWIGTYFNGLYSVDPNTIEVTHHKSSPFTEVGLDTGNIRDIHAVNKDVVWLGTTKGLFEMNTKNGTYHLKSLNDDMFKPLGDNISSINIISLFEDEKHNIWLGTDGGGLCKHDPIENSYTWFNKSNGLVQETVASIIEDNNGDIWLGGDHGISKLDIVTGGFSHFNTSDGLLANNFNYNSVFKAKDGVLYFGNYEGINYFNPNEILFNKSEPSLYFTDLKIFNKSVALDTKDSPLEKVISETEHVTFKHFESVFTLEFAGINYTRPQNNQYAYYLEGFENSWNYVGNTRSATYTNLSPGDYIFKVKAANNDGVWNESPISMKITVLAPWWSTNGAIFTYVLLILLLTYIIARYLSQRAHEKRLIKFERDQRVQEEILNERKIQFFTNISHEFRTPLTLILNPLRDIIENNRIQLNDSVKEKHRIILKNANRLTRLIDELMDFRKLHLNKMTLNASEINVISFVQEISAYFEEEAAEKNILFSVETDGTPLHIWGDPGMLEKIIFNILSNAFKATPENGVITIGVYNCKDSVLLPMIDEKNKVPTLEIVIEDSGSGINKADLEHIFERFYRSADRNQQYYGGSGTGIGLEVVQSFVSLHKGKIEVESKVDEGTKFRVFLPFGNEHLKESELILTSKTELIEDKTVENKITLNETEVVITEIVENEVTNDVKKTLLIVEDNVGLRTYLKGELENDYRIIEAENGKKGIQLANSGIPDLIISDVIMPEMDGFEFCTLIKQDIKTSHIPVLMLTAKAMSDDRVRGIDSGADAYLVKPFEMKVLRSYLKRLIATRQLMLSRFFKDVNNFSLPEKINALDKSFVKKVLDYINKNIGDADLNVELLADDMHLSRSQLYRKIKAMTGMTANEFIRKIRLEKAKQMIESSDESISEIGYKVGFSSPSYFTKCFKSHFGILPTEVKSN